MAVRGKIVVQRDWAGVEFDWWIVVTDAHGTKNACSVVCLRPYKSHKGALAAAKRQADRLGIDVTEQGE